VLLVEDNPADRCAFSLLLERRGYEVVTAGDGREALDYLRRNPPPCVILLDVKMPRMDGYHFRAVQQQDSALAAIPVVMMTGLVDRDSQIDRIAAVLAKPVTEERLLDAVRPFCEAPA
jgi:CheY-like chemotaxis protein